MAETKWGLALTEAGTLAVVPYAKGYSGWEPIGPYQAQGRVRASGLYDSLGDAWDASRALVGLAEVKSERGPQMSRGEVAEERARLMEELRPQVWRSLERDLRPLVEQKLQLQLERELWEKEMSENKEAFGAYLKWAACKKEEEAMDKSAEKIEAVGVVGKAKDLAGRAATTVRSDARKMAYRSFGRKIVQGAQAGLVRFLKDKGVGPKARQPLVDMIQSDAGKAVIGYTLGTLGTFLPGMAGKEIVAEACEELRIEAMSLGMDHLLSGIGDYLLPDIFGHVSALEAAVKPSLPTQKGASLYADVEPQREESL